MTKSTNKLTVSTARALTKPGRHSDGNGLYLEVRKSGSKYWIFMAKKNGKRTEIGLGGYADLSLVQARNAAQKLRTKILEGTSPKQLRTIEEVKIPNFLECAEIYLETKEIGWKNEKHRAQWHMTLKKYAKPLHHIPVDKIETPDVYKILHPIWLTKHETASRLRGRIEAVLDYGKAMGWRYGENPAVWRGNLKLILPQYSKTRNVKHHPALAFEDMAGFYSLLESREALVARLLEFTILTACRSGEARDATWREINFRDITWTVPAERMYFR